MRRKNKIIIFIFLLFMLVVLASCTGSKCDTGQQGVQGIQGEKGEDGNGIASISKTDTEGLVDTYTIVFTNGNTTTFTVTNGAQGIQGIQGEEGEDGHTPVITIGNNGNWFIDDIDTTKPAQGVQGETGNGISKIEKTETDGLVDTYTITFTNGDTTTFTVTNGEQGIQGIQGETGEDGHTPVITIGINGNWFIDDVDTTKSAQGLQGETGNGISKIEKTGTDGLVDTYTITFTNGDTTTFTVTNGEQGIQGIQGETGEDGHTPVITIGVNGNWFIDDVDTTKSAQGLQGETGNGISKIEKTGTDGLVDTYTITFTNGNTTTFEVINGSNGKSAYEIYLEYHPDYTGTEEEWINSFVIDNIKYDVDFDSQGGTEISSQKVYKGEKAARPSNPAKEGYTFDGWYYQGEKWSFIGYTVTESMTLVAKWNVNSYTLTLGRNNSKAGSISNNSGSHNYNEAITIIATTNPGYTFDGWYNGSTLLTEKTSYTFNMPANALSYTAKWTANTDTAYKVEHYLQNLDNTNYPSTPFEIDNLTGTTDTLTNGTVNTYEGFTSPSITQSNINGNGSTVIKLYYTRNSYTVSLDKNIDEAGTITGVGTYKYGKDITLTATTNPGYTFDGWYDDSLLVSDQESYTFELSANNLSYTATWIVNQYTITINNKVVGVTIDGVESGNNYEFNSKLTLSALNIPTGYTIKWSRSDGIIVGGDTYEFYVPAYEITITLDIVEELYTREGNKIYFGTYPQTKITEDALIDELNTLAGDLPTETNKYNWIDYNYYISSSVTGFMYYQDIDYDNDGKHDYRGVYFTEYRPVETTYEPYAEEDSFQFKNGYTKNEVYWFSYEPIEWDVLDESEDKALIIANLILDSQDFYGLYGSSTNFEHNGGTGYANNYKLSDIRKWLNDDFYNNVFDILQKQLIEITNVDNGSSNNNTLDYVFLLSKTEVEQYYTVENRFAVGTDYAKCQGLMVFSGNINSGWILRTPYYLYFDNIYYACDTSKGAYECGVRTTYYGIRPACWINL